MTREDELKQCKNELYEYWLDRCCNIFNIFDYHESIKIRRDDHLFHTTKDLENHVNSKHIAIPFPDIQCYSGNFENYILKSIAMKRNMFYGDNEVLFHVLEHIHPILTKYNIQTFKFGTSMVNLGFLYNGQPLKPSVIKHWTNI